MSVLGRAFEGLKRRSDEPAGSSAAPGLLTEVVRFGANPGNLRMFAFVPDGLPAGRPLVLVLHGCTQTAAGYDLGAGWSTLAERYGFALVFAQQKRANNPRVCFNWFQAEDQVRDSGEALSIREMVEHMIRRHDLDRGRVFVTGLSAGGAMTMVMLAAYPELFAGGAVIAGLPYGCAQTVSEAIDGMFRGCVQPAETWGDRVRAASAHRGPWPNLSVWHGGQDAVVVPGNAREIVKQWTNLHGLPTEPSRVETVDGHPRQVWLDSRGEAAIESYTLESMAHGTPLSTGENALGVPGPFLLDVGISSSYHIARFWGLATRPAAEAPARGPEPAAAEPAPARGGLRAFVHRALRAVGLRKS